jgi:protoheme IX farnesyltransferase
VLPWFLGFAGPVYAGVSVLGGLGMIYSCWLVYRIREGDRAKKIAMRNFGLSILYLFTLFAVLAGERVYSLWTGAAL